MRRIINHFTDDDLYKFTMCVAVVDNFPRTQVRYTFIDRDNTCYPPGFAAEVERQTAMLEELVITDQEVEFMQRRCPYIPSWFYGYLKGFRYDRRWVTVSQDCEGRLRITIEGNWSSVILMEVKILAIVSELYYIVTGQEAAMDYDAFAEVSSAKARRLLEAGCMFSD